MFMVSRALCAALLGVLFAAGTARAAPIEVYGRLPLIEDAQISPDGTMVAFAMTDGENRAILVKRLSDNQVVGGLRAGDMKVRDVRWAGSEHLIVTLSQTALVAGLSGPRREYLMSLSYELATRKQRGLMDRAENSMNTVLSIPRVRMVDGDLSAIVEGVNFVEGRGRIGLFRVKLKSGATRLIEPGFEDTSDWVVGQDGQALAQTEYDQQSGDWRLRFKSGNKWVVQASMNAPLERPWLAGLGRDGKSVLVVQGVEEGGQVMKEYGLAGGEPTVISNEVFDSVISDPASFGLLGLETLVGEQYRYTFFNTKAGTAWRSVVTAYGGDTVRLVSWSDDRRRIVVQVESPTKGPAYSLVDLDANSARWLGEIYDGLGPEDIAEVRSISYKAKDGLAITGYLTLPRGKEAKDLPLVVLPHGGPAARDVPGFDWWSQALAARGYAVLQPNFRGSDGFGVAFLEAGYGEFGRKMQTDLSDGVRDLAAKGIIDPKRVCIAGASYGGYAALAGATLDAGVYRCAVSIAGIADLKRFMEAQLTRSGPRENSATRYWARFLGVDGRKDPDLAAISPARFADRVEIPVMLIHGKDDTVVLYNQSQIMQDALKKAGKPVELVTLKGEDHWLSRGETRLQMLKSLVAFLEKHNPPN